ncbi:MAG: hypothetical protein M3T96_08035 [Acidobacteriota bacterium]|nr:hypothetical protein [Acidobacteriota bacterium]
MIQIKDAIERAKDSINEIFDSPEKLQIEAFVLSDDKKKWNVTYSFWQKSEPISQLQSILGITGSKVYKMIEIDAESGDIIGMKIGNTLEAV